MSPGTLVRLYEKTPTGTSGGYVMVGLASKPDVLYDVPDGTYALIVSEAEGDEEGFEPVAEVLIDGFRGYVQLSCCFEEQ